MPASLPTVTVDPQAEQAVRRGTHMQYLRRRPEGLLDIALSLSTVRNLSAKKSTRIVMQLVHELKLDLHAPCDPKIEGTTLGTVMLTAPHLLKHLISLGLQVNARMSKEGGALLLAVAELWCQTGLYPSLCSRILGALHVLLDAGANPDLKTADGVCPLQYALIRLQQSGARDLRLIDTLLPITTCMPLCVGLSSKDLVREMQRPAADVVAELIKLCHSGGQDGADAPLAPSPQLNLLLTSLQFRLPSIDTLFMLLPLASIDRYAEWFVDAANYSCDAKSSVSSAGQDRQQYGPELNPSLVAKYKAALVVQPHCLGLYMLLGPSQDLRCEVARDPDCRAALPQGLKAFLAKLGTSHELSAGAVEHVAMVLSQLPAMMMTEGGGISIGSMPGDHPWVLPFVDEDHWRDILWLLRTKGATRDQDSLVASAIGGLTVVVCCVTGGRLLRVIPEFLEELAGPSHNCVGLLGKQLRKLAKDASGGKSIHSFNLEAALGVGEMMAACRRLECLGLVGVEVLGPVTGVQDQDLPGYVQRMQERMREPMAMLRASELWKHIKELHSKPEPPACISAARLGTDIMVTNWLKMQWCLGFALQGSLPVGSSYHMSPEEQMLFHQQTSTGVTEPDQLNRSVYDRKADADMLARKNQVQARRLAQTCSNCRQAPVEFEGRVAAGLVPGLSKCSGCRVASYCSRECQLAHWKAGHKRECKELAAQRRANEAGASTSKMPDGTQG